MSTIIHYTVNTNPNYDAERTDNIPCIRKSQVLYNTPNLPLASRHPKLLYWLYFDVKAGDVIIYNDANIYCLQTAEQMIERYLGNADIAINTHPYRHYLHEEFAALENKYRNESKQQMVDTLREQFICYFKDNPNVLTKNFWENNFIIRRDSPRMRSLMQLWFDELIRFQHRDQPSFPYVFSQFPDLKMNTIREGNIRENPNFIYIKH